MLIPWTSSLVAAADSATVDIADDGTWTGTIALVNEWSADNRMLALAEGDEIDVRPLPLPVTVQYVTGRGHDGATVGLMTLDEVSRDGSRLLGWGRIDAEDPEGAALARKIRGGFFRFVSADIDKAAGRMVCVGEDGAPVDDCEPGDGAEAGELYTQWRIMGAALLAHPAFPEAQIGMAEKPVAPAAADDAAPAADTVTEPVTAAAFRHEGWAPDTEWFRSPDLADLQPVMVDDDGRVRGYLAAWGVEHRSYPGRAVTPPRSASGYALFNSRPIATSEGLVDVGLITMGTGHAGLGLNRQAAAEHYDHTGTMAAVVRAGEDSRGIWLAGAVLPDLSDEQRLRLSLSRFSGDWRQEGGGLELVAALAVNTEGFPVPTKRRTEQGDYALVAAGALPALAEEAGGPDIAALTDAEQGRRTRAGEAAHRVRRARTAMASRRLNRLAAARPGEEMAELANWVEKAGGLPSYIKRIAKHLQEKGMTESRAIATAVNATKKMCRTGDLNFPGRQDVNPGSRAEACAAVAEWEAKKAKSHA
ncbi:hypothetical protein EYS09_26210 [Streptomyces kasugaensis]|uniref:Uncharacterized protein n=1 Tax=Streptomyces kasugaensis TaxID=1946 RepID=A0A4V2JI17_STRKA|nr:hypothetical protein [Streptomyces kasugaensis]TBO56771.1 hypothetical protein EYS09_26210 [Streptomyces kasugaensis]